MKKTISYFLTIAFGRALISTSAAVAGEFYKDKSIRFIVGYAPGGGYDTYTRAIAAYRKIHSRPSDFGRGEHGRCRQPAGGKLHVQQSRGGWSGRWEFQQRHGDQRIPGTSGR